MELCIHSKNPVQTKKPSSLYLVHLLLVLMSWKKQSGCVFSYAGAFPIFLVPHMRTVSIFWLCLQIQIVSILSGLKAHVRSSHEDLETCKNSLAVMSPLRVKMANCIRESELEILTSNKKLFLRDLYLGIYQ